MKTHMIIVAAPSGAGKSSFVERACRESSQLEDIITFTTRPMRSHEREGFPYHFISHDEFQKRIGKGFFVEWAKVHSNFYGTSYESIESARQQGRVPIMDIDIQGVSTFKSKFEGVRTIFILPPSIDELRRRIVKRDGGEPSDMALRMLNAEVEIGKASEFEFQIINDEFESSYQKFKKIIEDLLRNQ